MQSCLVSVLFSVFGSFNRRLLTFPRMTLLIYMYIFNVKQAPGVSAGLSSCQLTESTAQMPQTTTSWWVVPTSSLTVDSIVVFRLTNCFLSGPSGQTKSGVSQFASTCWSHQRGFHHEGGMARPRPFQCLPLLYSLIMQLCVSPDRWCSTWASTSSRSSCMIRSSSTLSTAPTMNWAGFWESTASPSKSRGEISVSSDAPMIPTSVKRQQMVYVSEFCLRQSWRTWWLWRTKVRTSSSLAVLQKSRVSLRP